jgi:hypothetical protein
MANPRGRSQSGRAIQDANGAVLRSEGVEVMAGESARVEVRTCGEDDKFWNIVWVNGIQVNRRQNVNSIEEGERLATDLDWIVTEVYRRAYRDGYGAAQRVIRDALGVK